MREWRAVQDEVPLAVAFVLYSCICARYDLKPKGPGYIARETLAAMEAAEESA